MATLELTQENFNDVVGAGGIVLLDFWASWCGPCRQFAPVFEQASENHPDIVFGKIDTEAERELAGAFDVMSIPTLVAIRDRVVLFAQPGALPGPVLDDVIAQVRAIDMDEVRRHLAAEPAAGAPADEGAHA